MDDQEDIVSIERIYREGLPKRLIRMYMSRIGEIGGRVRSRKKTKACRLNAQKRWARRSLPGNGVEAEDSKILPLPVQEQQAQGPAGVRGGPGLRPILEQAPDPDQNLPDVSLWNPLSEEEND